MAKKRYIITFKECTTGRDYAADVLAIDAKHVQDGVNLLAAETAPAESEVAHFEEIGACVATLSDTDYKRVYNDKRVVEVVEDFEVFALGCCNTTAESDRNAYQEGYQDAVNDLLQALQQAAPMDRLRSPFGSSANPRFFCPSGSRLVIRCEPIDQGGDELQKLPWNIEMVRANDVWDRVTGKDVKVAIVDTGIDEDHPDLTVSGGASFVEAVGHWDDDHGHGTHCAGIAGARNNTTGVIGVAPECSLYAVKVLSGRGSGQLSWILGGMGWAQRNGMQVVSMSLGSNVNTPDADCVVAYQRAAQQLIDAGCIVIAAAGNNGRESNPWVGNPARCSAFMAVAAVDRDRQLASFSSRGPETLGPLQGVEISAPGVSINSTFRGGGYRELSGTSMACPHVSGAAALLKQLHPTWTPDRIRSRLKETAADLGVPGNDPEHGAGLLDCHRAVFG